jgi:hypothetical protein
MLRPRHAVIWRRVSICAIVVTAMTSVLVGRASDASADTRPTGGLPATVSADALATWQVNGVVWNQVVVGNTVYVVGQFSQARPPGVAAGGAGTVAANNVFAYDIRTGNRIASFNGQLNGPARAITASPDGSMVYVGGTFTVVNGAARAHVAAFNTATNALVSTFAPNVSGEVDAFAASGSTLYLGGSFSAVNGQSRSNLAAVNGNSGSLLPWAPSASGGTISAMTMTPDRSRVIVGGNFAKLNGVSAYGMGSLDAATAKTMPWAANATIRDAGVNGAIDTLASDGSQVYGAGWHNGVGANFEGSFAADPMTGKIIWMNDCAGDTYGVFPSGKVLYTVSHAHDCSPIGAFPEVTPMVNHHALAFTTYPTGTNTGPDQHGWDYSGQPDSTLLTWFPDLSIGTVTGQHQAAWSVAGNASYVVLGGEFPAVNGVAQQGLVRFAVSGLAPNKMGPTLSSGTTPSVTAPSAGGVSVSWSAGWDMDNSNLTYTVRRFDQGGKSTQVHSVTSASTFWRLPTMQYTDLGVQAGATYTYQVSVADPFGNSATSGRSAPVKPSSAGRPGSTFTPVGPCRAFDTRSGTGLCPGAGTVPKAPLGAGRTLTVKVAGVAGVPANATAVVLNLTAVDASEPTWVTAWAAGAARPDASNLNVSGSGATPNLVVVPVGAGGAISLYNAAGKVHLLGDISGYFAPQSGSSFSSVAPCRLFDTRVGGGLCSGAGVVPRSPLRAGQTMQVKVVGAGGVPSSATAVVVNLTAVGASARTWVTAWPTGGSRPTASNLNVDDAAATPNLAIVPVGADGTISLYNASGSVELIGDIAGYFAPGGAASFVTLTSAPCRVFDTRTGTGNCAGAGSVPKAAVGAGGTVKVKVTGVAGIPASASAVVLNLTGVGATASTWVTVWPAGQPMPVESALNLHDGNARANLAVVPVGAGGYIELYNAAGRVNLLGDISGYFAP